MSKLNQIKIPMILKDSELIYDLNVTKYILIRINDNLVQTGNRIKYIKWKLDESLESVNDNPSIGSSLILYPSSWMTTEIVEIVKNTESELYFKTRNSEYLLKKSI